LLRRADHIVSIVLKRNRAIRFDAFWITEPISEEDKPDLTLTLFEVPEELWDVMTEERTVDGSQRRFAKRD